MCRYKRRMDFGHLTLIALTFVLAGFVKGVIGLGLPTVGMGLLATVMTPAQAASLLTAPSFITNVWHAVGAQSLPLIRRTWTMLLGSCIGTWGMAFWVAPGLLSPENGVRASIALGIVLALYGVLGLSSVRFYVPPRLEPWLSPVIGLITGGVTAATGVYMIPSAPYLQAIGLDKDDLVLAMGISFAVSTLALAVVLIDSGALQTSVAGASLLALVPALAGMGLGQWVRRGCAGGIPDLLLRGLAGARGSPRLACAHLSGHSQAAVTNCKA
jgi:hypothetical protein